jgi:hypothetical protein
MLLPYDEAFEAFGTSIKARIAGATAVGVLFGIGIALELEPGPLGWFWCIAACASFFFLCGCGVGLLELRSRRIAAGNAKALPLWAVILLVVAVPVVLMAAGIAMFFL